MLSLESLSLLKMDNTNSRVDFFEKVEFQNDQVFEMLLHKKLYIWFQRQDKAIGNKANWRQFVTTFIHTSIPSIVLGFLLLLIFTFYLKFAISLEIGRTTRSSFNLLGKHTECPIIRVQIVNILLLTPFSQRNFGSHVCTNHSYLQKLQIGDILHTP